MIGTERIIPNASALAAWRKSSYSGPDGGNCLEVGDGHVVGIPVRDSKAAHGPAIVFTSAAWSAFVADLKRSA